MKSLNPFICFLALCFLFSCSTSKAVPPKEVPPSIPNLERWKSNMITFGDRTFNEFESELRALDERKHNDPRYDEMKESEGPYNKTLAATYYDLGWVMYQIGDYTGDHPKWDPRAKKAVEFYRDHYIVANKGATAGWWTFSRGLAEDYLRTRDHASRQALILMANKGAYASDREGSSDTASFQRSREVAYAIMTYLDAEKVGERHRPQLARYVDDALGHLAQWTGEKSFIHTDNEDSFTASFMMALTSKSLIAYEEKTGDQRVLPAVTRALDWLWNNNWIESQKTFKYANKIHQGGGTDPAPDLNLLIAPAYAWVYHESGDSKFRERALEIFGGGVSGAFLSNPKQFNQNYFWSFDMVKWLSEKVKK